MVYNDKTKLNSVKFLNILITTTALKALFH